MYKWYEVKRLKSLGIGIKTIARKLKISKNTVKKYLKDPNPPILNKREYVKSLDEYEINIKDMIENEYIGTRIYEELKNIGFSGSLSTVHRYINSIKETAKINKKMTTRFETDPGEQMQYDWTVWFLPAAGKKIRIYVHELVLSFSRKKYYTYSLSITAKDIIRAIVNGIEFFGGFAKELIIDNPKQMILFHNDIVIRYNDEFLRFLGLYGIKSEPCVNYRARTKGKVERPFFYIKEHLLRGLELNDILELDNLIIQFTENYNKRIHSTLKEAPEERFKIEKAYLKAIPKIEIRALFNMEIRKVTSDGYISFGGLLYPCPLKLCLRNVLIESIFGRVIKVYDEKGNFLVEHNINIFSRTRPEHPEHTELNNKFIEQKKMKRSKLINRFVELTGEKGLAFTEGLKINTGPNVYWHISEIINYIELYGLKNVMPAIEECVEFSFFDKNSVKKLITPQISVERTKDTAIIPSVNITRDLSYYHIEEA